MKFEDLNVTSLESWSVRGNIPSWPYDNSYFQVSELYIAFRPGPMVPFGNQTWQWEIYDWPFWWENQYTYIRVYIYILIDLLILRLKRTIYSINININKTMCILFLIRNRNRWEIRDLSPCLMRHGMCRILLWDKAARETSKGLLLACQQLSVRHRHVYILNIYIYVYIYIIAHICIYIYIIAHIYTYIYISI
jgi:hypothetical protein